MQIIRAKSDPAYKRECGPGAGAAAAAVLSARALLGAGVRAGYGHRLQAVVLQAAQGFAVQCKLLTCMPTAGYPLPHAAPYTSVLDCVRATLRTSGARGPFQVRGARPAGGLLRPHSMQGEPAPLGPRPCTPAAASPSEPGG